MDPLAVLGVVYLIIVIIWLLIAIATSRSAAVRGHRWFPWLIVGLLLGPLAWAFALSLHERKRQ